MCEDEHSHVEKHVLFVNKNTQWAKAYTAVEKLEKVKTTHALTTVLK